MKHLALPWLCAVALCALLGACATPAPPAASPAPFFRDERFAAPVERVGADELFALSDAMKRYLQVEIAAQLRRDGLQKGLIDALYRRDQLRLDYDAETTRNAAQAFEARKGNCLSLAIMTGALAKELGLQVSYQSVATEATWSRSGDIAFSSGHVNLTLGPRMFNSVRGYDASRLLTIDFLPPQDIVGQSTRPITEDTIVAMYMNNHAAEALARGQIDDAYWWARAAIERAPDFTSAFNTLGVVYLRHGDLPAARQALAQALEREPRNPQTLSNLVSVLDRLGLPDEAGALRVRLAGIEQHAPYDFFRRGMDAMRQGDFALAREMFAKEVDRADYDGEFHFWLGLAHLRLGDEPEARRQLAIAVKYSTTRDEHALYAAKLDHLRSQHAQ